MKFVNLGLSGSIKTKDPLDTGLMPDMSTGTTDISKIVEDTATFEVSTSENFTVSPQDMSLPWVIGNEGNMEAIVNFQTYNFDPELLVLAFGGSVSDEDSDGTDDTYNAPTEGFSLTYKAIQIAGQTVDGYYLTLKIRKAACRGLVHSQFGNSAGQVEWNCTVVTPENTSGVLQTPWSFENISAT